MMCDARAAPRVQEKELPRVTQGAITSSKKRAKKRRVKLRVATAATAPASNTRLKIAARAATVQPQRQTPKRSARLLRLMQPTIASNAKANSGTANTVKVWRDNRQLRRLTRRITKMETKAHQAMAVIDAESGKLLN